MHRYNNLNAQRKTDYNDEKQYRQQKHQQKNNQKTKIESKTTVLTFQATNKRNLTRENLDMIKESLKRETEPLLIADQNNAIRTNYIKARIDKIQKIVDVDYVVIETKRSII